MKNILLFSLLTLLFGCSKDLGNYDYTWQDKIQVKKFDRSTYVCQKGDELRVIPTFEIPEGRNQDEFQYLWIIKSKGSYAKPSVDTVGTEARLSYQMALPTRDYIIELEITDPKTGLQSRAAAPLSVSGSLSGWLFLEDNKGQADLSVYGKNSEGFQVYVPKILSNSGAPAEICQGPRKVVFTFGSFIKGKGVWILTDKSTFFLNHDDGHAYIDNQVLANFMLTPIGDNVSTKNIQRINPGAYQAVLFGDNGELYFSMFNSMLFGGNNSYFNKADLDIYPEVLASSSSMVHIAYDKISKRFLGFQTNEMWRELGVGAFGLAYPTGEELLVMKNVGSLDGVFITKKDNGDMTFYECTHRAPAMNLDIKSSKPFNSKIFNENTLFAAHQQHKYPYYSNGDNKLYTYTNSTDLECVIEGGAKIEGNIKHIHTRNFYNTHVAGWEHLAKYIPYIIVTTELSDGTGMVYFLKIKYSGVPNRLEIADQVATQAPVVSVCYQDPY